jgi:hypothetical protein
VVEQERAFAHRRLKFLRAITGVIAEAENEVVEVANALAVVRDKLGWASDSEGRTETLTHFAPVARAAFASLAPPEAEVEPVDVSEALAAFESWYAATHPQF